MEGRMSTSNVIITWDNGGSVCWEKTEDYSNIGATLSQYLLQPELQLFAKIELNLFSSKLP